MTTAITAPTLSGAPHSDNVIVKLRWAVSDTLTGADLNEHQIVASMNGQSAAMGAPLVGSASAPTFQ